MMRIRRMLKKKLNHNLVNEQANICASPGIRDTSVRGVYREAWCVCSRGCGDFRCFV